MSLIQRVKNKLFHSEPNGVENRKPPLSIARLVFNKNTNFIIQKTWVVDVNKTSILVPKKVRKDTTGRKHLTNDISSGEMYNVGILLSEPKGNEWNSSIWRRENTAQFRGYITQNNHITIPVKIRDKFNITDGDTVQIAIKKGRIFESETNTPNKSHIPEWMEYKY